ncbi:hypothetical protein LINPERHAP1_LOCUS37894 [Linum perenne]
MDPTRPILHSIRHLPCQLHLRGPSNVRPEAPLHPPCRLHNRPSLRRPGLPPPLRQAHLPHDKHSQHVSSSMA